MIVFFSGKIQDQSTVPYLSYRKDTEPFISCFHVLTSNTSFQYLSIHAMTFIACYSYMLSKYQIRTKMSGIQMVGQVTRLLFKYWTPILSGIQMNPVYMLAHARFG